MSGDPTTAFMQRRHLLRGAVAATTSLVLPSWTSGAGLAAAEHAHRPAWPPVEDVELQPLIAHTRRLIAALETLGEPLPAADLASLHAAMDDPDERGARAIQAVLDRSCLVQVTINPEMRVSVLPGSAARELHQAGWRSFLVKVHNQSGTTAQLRVASPNGQSAFSFLPRPEHRGPGRYRNAPDMIDPPETGTASDSAYETDREAERLSVLERWLDLAMHDAAPLAPTLSGATLEYRILGMYARDAGQREATLAFDVGQGTQDLGFRAETALLFDCKAATTVRLRVREADGTPTIAAFVIRDGNGRIVPSRAKRLAPDFGFQPQVYRADGEELQFAAGRYEIEFRRGPESVPQHRSLIVRDASVGRQEQQEAFVIERWIDPARHGYWSGDHHIHAAGCAHYLQPTEGVGPRDMFRQTLGEDLKVGAALTWGPGFDHQKQFFAGRNDATSKPPYLLHYDVEVSGFGSDRSGHLVLLGLTSQVYPGGDSSRHWPTLGLNTLRWAKAQGAVCGAAHAGFGLAIRDEALPSYEVPAFDGIGANEFIVDVTHEVPGIDRAPVPAIDFLGTCDSPAPWELNIWYHVLNAGYRPAIAGESDFPCIYGERVGTGRSYARVRAPLTYRGWCEAIAAGRSYVSDGRAHLLDFRVDGRESGDIAGDVSLGRPGTVAVSVRAAALLPVAPAPALASQPWTVKPYWHVERARLQATRSVPLELVVNGVPVARRALVADGALRDIVFDGVEIGRSSWIAVRILPAAHTNPVFVIVDGEPVRGSCRSLQWCIAGVERCWSQKSRFIAVAEADDARAAYEHARAAYRARLRECAGA